MGVRYKQNSGERRRNMEMYIEVDVYKQGQLLLRALSSTDGKAKDHGDRGNGVLFKVAYCLTYYAPEVRHSLPLCSRVVHVTSTRHIPCPLPPISCLQPCSL